MACPTLKSNSLTSVGESHTINRFLFVVVNVAELLPPLPPRVPVAEDTRRIVLIAWCLVRLVTPAPGCTEDGNSAIVVGVDDKFGPKNDKVHSKNDDSRNVVEAFALLILSVILLLLRLRRVENRSSGISRSIGIGAAAASFVVRKALVIMILDCV